MDKIHFKMDKGKVYRATYKVYPNTKIKPVNWHGKSVYPLYLQLIYDRKNTVYKSNLFDLYLKPKYGIRVAGELHPPPLDEVIAREEKLVEFIINKHADDFSLELFKKEYDYYSQDLLDEMEPGFVFYMHTFFQDEGMPHLADALQSGAEEVHAADIVLDLKRSLKPDLYGRMVEHSFLYSPYLALFWFAERNPRKGLTSIILTEWKNNSNRDQFIEYVQKNFSDKSSSEILDLLTRMEV